MENCKKKLNLLCFVCGKYTPYNKQRKITELVEEKYADIYGILLIFHDHTPHRVCTSCQVKLHKFSKETLTKNESQTPFLWGIPKDDHSDCYACLVPSLYGIKWSDREKICYPQTSCCVPPSVIVPEIHSSVSTLNDLNFTINNTDTLKIEKSVSLSKSSKNDSPDVSSSTEPNVNISEYLPKKHRNSFHPNPLDQETFDDMVRDLQLDKKRGEKLGTLLRERDLIRQSTHSTHQRHRGKEYQQYFSQHDHITYVNDVDGLFNCIGYKHKSSEWRLFMDSCKKSFKVRFIFVKF